MNEDIWGFPPLIMTEVAIHGFFHIPATECWVSLGMTGYGYYLDVVYFITAFKITCYE
jgi:hypothetical protein